MNAREVLETAAKLVSEDRHETHGPKQINFDNIASYWNLYFRLHHNTTFFLAREDVAMMMALLKVARTLTGDSNDDDYVDAAGYLACAAELRVS